MKRKLITFFLLAVCLAAVPLVTGCNGAKVLPDPNPYRFDRVQPAYAETDADMTIDGAFDEARWQQVRWLVAQDYVNSALYADISFTTSFGADGIYFGMKVVEHGSTVYMNSARRYVNSCIEMYFGLASSKEKERTMEFDFFPDGSITNRVYQTSDLYDVLTTYDELPYTAALLLDKEEKPLPQTALNTDACVGYQIEAYMPFGFLEACGYDISNIQNEVLGINPLHIFSFSYSGTNLDEDRRWSDWSLNYISSTWLIPNTFFRFDKNGLRAYDFNVTYGGSGKGTVETLTGLNCLLEGKENTLVIRPRNNAAVTKFVVDGVDCAHKLTQSGGSYLFKADNPTADLAVEVNFN